MFARRDLVKCGSLAVLILSSVPAAGVEDNATSLFKVITVKDEIVIGLSTDELKALGGTDASAVAHKIEGVVGPDSELVELAWVPIEEATHLDMPTITGVVLEELAARVAAGMGHDLPVPFYFMIERQFFRELL